jgi:hypothetical protein
VHEVGDTIIQRQHAHPSDDIKSVIIDAGLTPLSAFSLLATARSRAGPFCIELSKPAVSDCDCADCVENALPPVGTRALAGSAAAVTSIAFDFVLTSNDCVIVLRSPANVIVRLLFA